MQKKNGNFLKLEKKNFSRKKPRGVEVCKGTVVKDAIVYSTYDKALEKQGLDPND